MEHLCLAGTEVYIISPDHITKMASMPIYGKNPLKIFFFGLISQMTLNLAHSKRDEPFKVYINDDPRLTLTYFSRSTLFIYLDFKIGKVCQHF